MKRVKTKVLSILLAVVMMLGLMPSLGQVAYAAGEKVANLHWNENTAEWDAYSGAEGYKVILNVIDGITPIRLTGKDQTGTSADFSEYLLPGNEYRVQVAPKISGEYGETVSASKSVSGSIGKVENVVVNAAARTASWDAVEGATGYDVWILKGGYQIGAVRTTTAATYDFSSDVTNEGTGLYSVKVSAYKLARGNYLAKDGQSPEVNISVDACTVTFDANGHGAAPAAQTINSGSLATEPSALPEDNGWFFGGWYTEAACTNPFDFSTPITENIILYAKWAQFAFTIQPLGGTSPMDESYIYTWQLSNTPETIYLQTWSWTDNAWERGNSLAGKTSSTVSYAPGSSIVNYNPLSNEYSSKYRIVASKDGKDIYSNEFTVSWIRYFEVNFNSTGGSAVASQKVKEGETATQPGNPTRSGYTFDAWYTGNSEADLTAAFDFSTPITDSLTPAFNPDVLTLYAKWTEGSGTPATHTVKFNANGGTGTMADVTVTAGDKLTLPACGFTPQDGKEFDKWDAGNPGDEVEVTADCTITAIWKDKAVTPPVPTTYDVTVHAVDEASAALAGVKLQLLKDGSVLDEWTSTSSAHIISGLVAGDYTIHEVEAPEGYKTTADQAFSIMDADVEVIMAHAKTEGSILSVDESESPLAGANLQILDPADLIVDEWSADTAAHVILGLKTETTYKIHEKTTPAGYTAPADQTFVIAADGTVTYSGETNSSEDMLVKHEPIGCTVTFDANGHGTAPAAQTVNSGETATEPTAPTESGWTFGGWYTEAACTTKFDFSTAITSDITLYAKWTEESVAPPVPVTYTVTFDANGHGTAPTAQIVNSGETANEPTAPTESGWTFGGWYTEAACTTKFDFGTAITGDITLYAKWTEESVTPPVPTTYTVTFETNGGSAVASQTVNSGEKATKPADPTKSGFVFDGWYADATFSVAFDFDAAITADVTIYAKWKDETPTPVTYTVTFDANGHGTAPAAQTVNSGETATEPAAPTESGWTFGGWYTEAACTTKFDFSTAITGDITLYAKWTEESVTPPVPVTYTVTFETNGGSSVASQTVDSGEKATKPADPTKSGFVFDGWYQDATFATAFDFDAAITADVTVYAKWKEEAAPGEIVYMIVSGGNSTWTKGSSSGVTIVVKRNPNDTECFSHFTSVQIDGTALVNDTDFSAVAGSTVITLNASALQKLTTGTKTVTINFDDGKATTSLIIKAGSSGTSGGTSPKTGDNSNPGLWITVMVLSGLGLGGLVVTDKKRRYMSRH